MTRLTHLSPMPEGSTGTAVVPADFLVATLWSPQHYVHQPGTYVVILIKEVTGTQNIQYDRAATVTYNVVDDGTGQLVATRTMTKTDEGGNVTTADLGEHNDAPGAALYQRLP